MITEVVGNLLQTNKCNLIIHQANLFHTFGAGIAHAILEKFPEAYAADKATTHGDESNAKLGSYSLGRITDSKGTSIKNVINLYSQTGIGGKDRQTSYDAMVQGLTSLRNRMEKNPSHWIVGIPYQMGCGLANGSWTIVRAILEDIFGRSPVEVYIYKLPELV